MPTKTATLTQMAEHYELSDRNLIIFGDAGKLHESIKTRVIAIFTEYRLRTDRSIAIAPDLAIEIISDLEQAAETGRKLRNYLDAGVEASKSVARTAAYISLSPW